MRRSAFTLIELIFAIIIIAIVVVSMPLMMKTNEEAIEANIAQEAIFASSAKMMQMLSYPWDSNATDSTNPNTYGKVVDITDIDSEYNRSNTNGDKNTSSSYRVGHILQDNHRRFHDHTLVNKNVTGITSGGDSALNNISATDVAFENPATSATGYKNAYKMDVDVSFVPDKNQSSLTYNFSENGDNTPTTNMKLIKVTIKKQKDDGTMDTITVLRSYSANIGEFDFAKRRF